jgi:hypothetical protein
MKKTSVTPSENDTVLSMIESDLQDAQASYLSRGREFAGLSNDQLQRQWIEAFRRMVETMTEQARDLQVDLLAELGLRALQPDVSAVEPEFRKYQELIKREGENDSERLEEGLESMIEEYLKRSGRNSN